MAKSIYLINPSADFPTYFGAESYAALGYAPTISIADLALTTIAAMVPADWHIRLCEESVEPVDYDVDADFIGITGKITQWSRMQIIAAEFRRRGKRVIFGGPFASLSPDLARPHCDILVRGEMEEIAAGFFADLDAGRWQDEYVGTKPDLKDSPIPRWDLYPNHRALTATVQTSRGCPFECEFCDVIQYLGRKQRHKPIDQVIAELDLLYNLGYRNVFLADDNFTVYRARCKELLQRIKEWNAERPNGPMSFITQSSIDAAKDPELLQMCADAGLRTVFIGIESPNPESLAETKKRQNLKIDLLDQVNAYVEHGIAVMGGMIVGFDADDLGIFQRQYDFAMDSPIPVFSLGALVAPAATPLYARMQEAGRLIDVGQAQTETAAGPWNTNIEPALMTREQLLAGVQDLCRKIYDPAAFEHRLHNMLDRLGERTDLQSNMETVRPHLRDVDLDTLKVSASVRKLGPAEEQLYTNMLKRLKTQPQFGPDVLSALMSYRQIRHMYEMGQMYEPHHIAQTVPAQEIQTEVVRIQG